MAYIIFGDNFSFPEGDASTNRVYTYAKGLTESGIKVHIICFGNEYTPYGTGVSENIKYYHPFNQVKRNEYFIIRRWQKFIKYFRTFSLVRKLNREEKVVATLVYTMRLTTYLYSWLLSKIFRSKLLKECSEHPLIHYQSGRFKIREGIIKLSVESRLSDGIFCISRYLIDFFKKQGVPQKKLFLIPSTVDPNRFKSNGESPFPFPYVGYFGGLTFVRDNVDILVRAFAAISEKHPGLHLVLGGFSTQNEKKMLNELIIELNMSSKVEVLEYLPRNEIIRYIIHSNVLVMVRAKGLETQASFPSKLTEYLSTSKPVISVDVGEVSDYLTDGVNCFLVEPGDCDNLSGKLDYVLKNYESALKVAEEGNVFTKTVFNYNYQSKRIIQYVDSLYQTQDYGK